jgi:hypothetical protein
MFSFGGSSLVSTGVAAAAVSVASFFSSFVGVSDICHNQRVSALFSQDQGRRIAHARSKGRLYHEYVLGMHSVPHRLLTFRARERPARSAGRDDARERAPRWRRPADGAGAKASVPPKMASTVTAEMTANFIALLWRLYSPVLLPTAAGIKSFVTLRTCFYGSACNGMVRPSEFVGPHLSKLPGIQRERDHDAAKARPLRYTALTTRAPTRAGSAANSLGGWRCEIRAAERARAGQGDVRSFSTASRPHGVHRELRQSRPPRALSRSQI